MSKLFVFNSSRGIKKFYDSFKDGFLPKTLTLNEFFETFTYVDDLFKADELSRLFCMQEAIKRTKNIQEKLKFKDETFEFLKRSDYLFKFFKELTNQFRDIKDLFLSDTYLDYEEHLEILDELLINYKDELYKKKMFDDITLPFYFKINENIAKNYSLISIALDGVFSKFECEVIKRVAKIVDVEITLVTSKFNKDLIRSNFDFLEFSEYEKITFNLSKKEILKKEKINKNLAHFRPLKSRSLQALYVFEKISSLIKAGIDPKNIFIITPDEEFNDILKAHDFKNMLNFAAGFSIKNTKFYQAFDKLLEISKSKKEIIFSDDLVEIDALFLKSIDINSAFILKFQNAFGKDLSLVEFSALIFELLNILDAKNLRLDIKKILFELSLLDISGDILFELFFLRLKDIKIPHSSGGEISVIGLLEAREIEPEGLIIIDFNDTIVPKKIASDMFLSTKVKQNAGLITINQRINLQKFYYESLINRSKICYISCLKDEINSPSKFLKQLNLKDDNEFSDKDYLQILNWYPQIKKDDEKEIILEFDFTKEMISFNLINTFLTCKRKFYYAYILKIPFLKKVINLEDDQAKLGSKIHKVFEEYFKEFKSFNYDKFIQVYLEMMSIDKIDLKLDLLKFKKLIPLFAKYEETGFIPVQFEKRIELKIDNLNLVGIVDRIDRLGQSYFIIDYKNRSIANIKKDQFSALQIEFYKLLVSRFFKSDEVRGDFLSLKDCKFFEYKNDKMDELKEILSSLKQVKEINFSRCEDLNRCKFCDYKVMCGRD